jgi:hypothetical protein
MVDVSIHPCTHDGTALWVSHWEWWCGNCGVTFPEYELLNFIDAHHPGDVHAPNGDVIDE